MDYSLDLVLKYPLIKINLTEESDIMLINGKMFVDNVCFTIALRQVTLIDGKQTYTLEMLRDVNKIVITKIEDILKNNDFENIVEVLDNIQDILKLQCTSKRLENHCDIYRKVIHEYSEFTKFFLNLRTCALNEDFSAVSASITDSQSRDHYLEVSIDYSKKTHDIFTISKFDLPLKDEDNFKPNESLVALFDQYLAKIELLQPYFDFMEDFDRNATVLDPDKPKRKDVYRRIWLGENISAIITVDPYNIFQRPDVKFLGPDRLVEPYTIQLNENLGKWVYQENIFQAVLDLLGLEHFPKKETTSQQVNLLVEYGECSICFSLRLCDKLPEIICTNKSCERFYHNECLHDVSL